MALVHLNLRGNGGDEGAGRLAAVLGQCASLDLCDNGIDCISFEYADVAHAIRLRLPPL